MSANASEAPAGGDDSPGDYPEWLSLDADERVEWVGEPAMVSLYGTAIWGVVLLPVLIGILILLALPFAYLSLKNTDYVATNKSLYVKKGILGTHIESVGLDKIQNTEYSQSFWGKRFGFGSIEVSSAGSGDADLTFGNVEDPRTVRDTVSRLASEYGGRGAEGRTDETGAPAQKVSMDDLVAELRATRESMERIEAALAAGSADGSRGSGEERATGGEEHDATPDDVETGANGDGRD